MDELIDGILPSPLFQIASFLSLSLTKKPDPSSLGSLSLAEQRLREVLK